MSFYRQNFRWAYENLQPKEMRPYLSIYKETSARRSQFFDEEKYADVTLTCGGKEFKCSSLILAESSSIFEAMFNAPGFKESATNSANISEIGVNAFEKVIRFLYNGSIELEPSNILEVFNFANQYDVTPLRDACGDYLFEEVTVESVMNPLWRIAKMFQAKKLSQNCLKYALDNFTLPNTIQIHSTKGFLQTDEDLIQELLVHSDIKILHERDVLFAIVDWVMFDQPNRQTMAFKMLKYCLRKDYLDGDDIFECYHRYENQFSDVTHQALSQFTSCLLNPLFISPFRRARTNSKCCEKLLVVVNQTEHFCPTYFISFPCTRTTEKKNLEDFSRRLDVITNQIRLTVVEQKLYLQGINNLQREATIQKIVLDQNEQYRQDECYKIPLLASAEKLILKSESILVVLSIFETNKLSIEFNRKGLTNSWKTEKMHIFPNVTISKSNLNNSVCFKRYVIIFEPEKHQAHVFDCNDPEKLRLVNIHFDQTDTDVPRVAAQKHNLVVFISRSRIFLADIKAILFENCCQEDENKEPAAKKAKTDGDSLMSMEQDSGQGTSSDTRSFKQQESESIIAQALFTSKESKNILSAAFSSTRFYVLAKITATSLICFHCLNREVMQVLNGATRKVKWGRKKVSYSSDLSENHRFTAEMVCVHHEIDDDDDIDVEHLLYA